MIELEAYQMILVFVGLFVVGVGIIALVARLTGIAANRVDHRKEFFKLVESAREAEILEKRPVSYDVSGIWKGEGDGYFGVGKNLEIQVTQNISELNGRIIDQFGYSQFRGFFVWPYLWFDFERHGTIFEFRGIIKEHPDGAAIAGKYRYFHDDAEWNVKRVGLPPPKPVQSAAPRAVPAPEVEQAAENVEEKPENTISLPEPQPEVIVTKQKIAKEDIPVLLEFPPIDERIKPVPRGDTDKSPYQRGKAGKCPDCNNDFEEILSFCIYCGTKKEDA
jgi:hypothetical protein